MKPKDICPDRTSPLPDPMELTSWSNALSGSSCVKKMSSAPPGWTSLLTLYSVKLSRGSEKNWLSTPTRAGFE